MDVGASRSRALYFMGAVLAGAFYMPLRDHVGPWVYQALLLPATLTLIFCVWRLLGPDTRLSGFASRFSWPSLLGSAGFLLQGLTLLSLPVIVHKFRAFDYLPDWKVLGGGYGLSMAAFAYLGWKGHQGRGAWVALVLGSYAFGMLASIAYFPLDTGRSDMLFMLRSAGDALIQHGVGAVYTHPPDGIQVNYLPGLWISYFPATWAGMDLRIVSLLAAMGACALLLAAAPKRLVLLPIFLAACLLLSPWFQFRHEAYVHGLLFFGALLGFAVVQERFWLASLSAAWLAAMSQLAWPMIPFYFLYLIKKRAWGSLVFALGALLAAGLVVLPFALATPAQLWENCFGGWLRGFDADSPNLSFWITRILPWQYLHHFQAFVLAGIFFYAVRRMRVASAADFFKWSSLALLFFVTSNSPVRDYFFYFPFLFLAFSLCSPPRPATST